jgi:hypothetical protein
MRHALERQNLLVAWTEKRVRGGTIWEGESVHGKRYSLTLIQGADSKWQLEYKMGKGNDVHRRTADCHTGLPKGKSFQLARRILQRVTQMEA